MAEKWIIGLGKRLRFAHMAFSRALRFELGKVGITFGQFVHLERLWDEDGLTQVELSRRVGVEAASSTAIIRELERLGFLKRERNPEDRRQIKISLTSPGAELRSRLLACASLVNEKAKESMSADEIARLFDDLEGIARRLSSQYPQSSEPSDDERLGP